MSTKLGTSALLQSMEAMTSSKVQKSLLLLPLGFRQEQYPMKCEGEVTQQVVKSMNALFDAINYINVQILLYKQTSV